MDFSYEEIAKYVLDYEIDGNRVVVEFQNEAGEVFDGSAIIKQSNTIQNQITKKVGHIAKSQARRHASRLVRSALGGGMLGRLGSTVVRSSVNNAEVPGTKNFSESDIQEAIAKAFKRVSRNFSTQAAGARISSRDQRLAERDRRATSRVRESSRIEELDFQGHLAKHPIKNLFEQDILSRVLVSIARADGRITEDERNFISEMLPKKIGTISEIAERGEISSVEAEELDSDIKKSVLLLAWAVALVDFDLDPAENRKLNEFAALFGFSGHEAESIATLAKYETLTSVLDPYMSKDQLYEASDGLDLSREEAERMMIQFKKSIN